MEKEYAKGNYVLVGADFNQELRDLTKEEIEKHQRTFGEQNYSIKTLLKISSSCTMIIVAHQHDLTIKPYEKRF